MKIKRMFEMSRLERAIMLMIWKDIQKLPLYESWRKYERGFKFEDKDYNYKCLFKIQDGNLRLREVSIEHAQVIIELKH